MKYDIDDVVTLDDGKEYYIIDKNVIDNDVYFYAVEYNDNIDKMLDNEFCFFKDDNGYLIDVTDLDLIEKLYNKFLEKTEDTVR